MFITEGNMALKGRFAGDVDAYTDGTMAVRKAESPVLDGILREDGDGYTTWFVAENNVPVMLFFPSYMVNSELRGFPTAGTYRISGDLQVRVLRGIGFKEYFVRVLGIYRQ